MRHGQAAWASSMDMQQGHAVGTCSVYMLHGLTTCTCCMPVIMSMLHGHAARQQLYGSLSNDIPRESTIVVKFTYLIMFLRKVPLLWSSLSSNIPKESITVVEFTIY
jgi:hypothetical protein